MTESTICPYKLLSCKNRCNPCEAHLRELRLEIEVRPRPATPPRPVNGARPEANIARSVRPRRAGRRLAINRQAT